MACLSEALAGLLRDGSAEAAGGDEDADEGAEQLREVAMGPEQLGVRIPRVQIAQPDQVVGGLQPPVLPLVAPLAVLQELMVEVERARRGRCQRYSI